LFGENLKTNNLKQINMKNPIFNLLKNIFNSSPLVHNIFISKKLIRTYLPPNPVIIDCGAYDGKDSLELVKFRGSAVYSFEPIPSLYDRLKANTEFISKIKSFNLALADFNGTAKMFVSSGQSDGSSSLIPPEDHLIDHPEVYFKDQIEVNCITLDEWARQNEINKIDMLWLDMQGYELPMLKASKNILPTVKVIHTEVSLKESYKNVSQYPELKEFLCQKGFSVEVEAIPTGYDMGNVLFVRKQSVD
jgi:FkbM family methyltransferase